MTFLVVYLGHWDFSSDATAVAVSFFFFFQAPGVGSLREKKWCKSIVVARIKQARKTARFSVKSAQQKKHLRRILSRARNNVLRRQVCNTP